MQREAIGVLNSGSSSLKFAVFGVEDGRFRPGIKGQIQSIQTSPHFVATLNGRTIAEESWREGVTLSHADATEHVLAFLRDHLPDTRLVGIGHRVVHGGLSYDHPVRIDAATLSRLEELIPLAPLHQPYNIAPIRLGLERMPNLPQVACFDTEFHRTIPEMAQMFAIPIELHNAGVRRYGFHGLSYEYVASRLAGVDSRASSGKCVALHLGNGASMCAMQNGQSMATTMGFTAVDGLPMGTRSGTIDPGALVYLMEHYGMDGGAIEKLIYHQSGLLGVSGISSDMRALLRSRDSRAKLAVDLFTYRISREVGSLTAALKGLDAMVFTGGIGENSSYIRHRVCSEAAWLGVELDPAANEANGPRISTEHSRVAAWVIPTDEELMIAQHTRRIIMQ
jgi:acetate kinase